ncbi:MAG: YdcH family protein [Caulobacterales bacterium]|jgi:hypothetical protein
MSLEARIRELDARHRELDTAIQREFLSPSSDTTKLNELKRQKLRLKEQIEQLRTRVTRH